VCIYIYNRNQGQLQIQHVKPWQETAEGHRCQPPNLAISQGSSLLSSLPLEVASSGPCLLPLQLQQHAKNSPNGRLGIGISFPTNASGQLKKARPIDTNHSCQLSLTVEANLPRNSTISAWSITVITMMPIKRWFPEMPLNIFSSSGLRELNSLNT